MAARLSWPVEGPTAGLFDRSTTGPPMTGLLRRRRYTAPPRLFAYPRDSASRLVTGPGYVSPAHIRRLAQETVRAPRHSAATRSWALLHAGDCPARARARRGDFHCRPCWIQAPFAGSSMRDGRWTAKHMVGRIMVIFLSRCSCFAQWSMSPPSRTLSVDPSHLRSGCTEQASG
jgi:hypothetical protein